VRLARTGAGVAAGLRLPPGGLPADGRAAGPGCRRLPRPRVRRRGRRDRLTRSDDLPDDLALEERQPLVAPEVGVGEAVLVEAELVQDRRVDVAEVTRVLDGPQPDGVRGADD